jgi:hypothetical protein
MELHDLRDILVSAGLIALSAAAFVLLLIYSFVGYKTWRGVRALNRLSEEQLRTRLDSFNERTRELIDDGALTGSGLTALVVGGVRAIQERRKPKRKKRFRVPGFR